MNRPPALPLKLKMLLASNRYAPLTIKLALLPTLGPRAAAQLAPYLPKDELRALALELSPAFLAQLILTVHPEWILDAYLSLPDQLLLDIARELCRNGNYATAALYGEYLPSQRLRPLVFGLEPESAIKVAKHMTNLPLILDSLRSFSAKSMGQLVEASWALDNLEISLAVLEGISLSRKLDVLRTLPEPLQRVLIPHFLRWNPELSMEAPEDVRPLLEQQSS